MGSPSSINRLDQAAKSAGITIIPHCGLDPGIDRILISYGVSKLDTVEEVTVRCGGFPQKNLLPCPLEGEGDLVVMRVDVNGYRSGRREALTFEMIDRYDERNGLMAMSRTTGFPCSIVAQMIVRGEIGRVGVMPPEVCVPHEKFFTELAKRGIKIASSHKEDI